MTTMNTRRAAACAMIAGFAASTASAQIFQREIGLLDDEWAYSIDTTMDGGSVSAGYKRDPRGDSSFHIVKYFPDGSTEWEATFGGDGPDVAYSIQQTKDGGYIVAGESLSFAPGFEIVLLRLDPSGAQVWANAYPGSFMVDPIHTPHPGVALDQGWEDEIYVVGRSASTAFPGGSVPIAFRADMGGSLDWYAEYFVPAPDAFVELAFTDVAYSEVDRTAVISGTLRAEGQLNPDLPPFASFTQDATLLKVASEPTFAPGGAPLWFFTYDSVFDRDNPDLPNVFETGDGLDVFNDGEIILAGRTDLGIGGPGSLYRGTHLVHTDPGGTPFWTMDYESFTDDGVRSFVETAYAAVEYDRRRDEFIQTGRVSSPGSGGVNAHTQLTAPGGAPIWAWQYGGPELRTFGESVQPREDNCGYVYAGRIDNPGAPAGQGRGDVYHVANNDDGVTGCLERRVVPEPVAPLRQNQVPIVFEQRQEFIELPELTQLVDGLNNPLCLDDDCDPGSGPCNEADLAAPFGVLDLADIDAFVIAFFGGDPLADIAPPFGVLDLNDIDAFIIAFFAGCP